MPPVGCLLREHADEGWEVWNLPALSEGKGDALGQPEGEALWPERFPVEDLKRTRSLIRGANFAALYQGRPAAAEGAGHSKLHFAKLPDIDRERLLGSLKSPASTRSRGVLVWRSGTPPDPGLRRTRKTTDSGGGTS